MKGRFAVALLVLLFAVAGASAQTQIGLNAVGAKIGLIMPEDPIDNTIGFGAQLQLGHVIPQIALGAFVDFWSKSYGEKYGGAGAEVSFTEIAVGAVGKYYFPASGNIKPYAGAGLALNFGRSKVEVAGVPGLFPGYSESDTDTDIGIHLVGGAEMPLSPTIDGFAEVKYAIDGADYFAIMVGAMYKLGK